MSEETKLFMNDICKKLELDNLNQICWSFELTRRIQKLKINPDKLFSLLLKYDAYITGSFILQVIKKLEYEDSDIDIYIKSITDDAIKDFEKLTKTKHKNSTESYYVHKNNSHNVVFKLFEFPLQTN